MIKTSIIAMIIAGFAGFVWARIAMKIFGQTTEGIVIAIGGAVILGIFTGVMAVIVTR